MNQTLQQLFDQLHREGVRYCCWDRRELADQVTADILIDESEHQAMARATAALGFKRCLGFDAATGTLIRLRISTTLVVDGGAQTGYRLPWESVCLSTRVLEDGAYGADHHIALLLLLVREALAVEAGDVIRELFGRYNPVHTLVAARQELVARVRQDRLRQIAIPLIGARAARLLPVLCANSGPTARALRAFRRRVEPALVPVASQPPVSTRGRFVAFLGVDGAGKSTLTTEIARWLSAALPVTTTYGGSGKGSASWPRRVMQTIAGWRRRWIRSSAAGTRDSIPSAASQPSLGRLIWLMALTAERRRRATVALQAKVNGMVVLSDRLPQSQFPGWNDGPRLGPWRHNGSRLRRYAAEREAEAFRLVDLVPPDLVVKLHVSPNVASQRKPETRSQQLLNGIRMVRGLQFPPTTRVVDVDAEQPLPRVLIEAKRAVWECL